MIFKGKQILEHVGKRLDKVILSLFPDFSRSFLQKSLKNGEVFVNGKSLKSGYILKDTDILDVKIKFIKDLTIKKQDLGINILFENNDYLVVFKPSGILSHLDKNYRENTLINGLIDYINVSEFEDLDRPGIVHRLDKETSGVMIVCKTRKAFDFYFSEFKNRKVQKKYRALVFGTLKHSEGVINSPICRDTKSRKKMCISSDKKAKASVTEYSVISEFEFSKLKFSLLDIDLKTGRTHQIRVHLAAIGHPVVGDFLYGNKKDNSVLKGLLERTFLEAYSLSFRDLNTLKINTYTIPLSEDLNSFLDKLL